MVILNDGTEAQGVGQCRTRQGLRASKERARRFGANGLGDRMNKSVMKLVKEIRANGYEVEKKKGGHIRVETSEGPIFFPSSPSDHRALKNARSLLRRRGVL